MKFVCARSARFSSDSHILILDRFLEQDIILLLSIQNLFVTTLLCKVFDNDAHKIQFSIRA